MQETPQQDTVKVAVIQAGAYLMDTPHTLEKALALVQEAARQGAQLMVFPEAFLGGYPRGLGFGAVVGHRSEEGRKRFARYHDAAILIPGPETAALAEAAREAHSYLAIGVIEKDVNHPRGTLYCTLLYFDPDGKIIHKHRKLKPTGSERLIWGEGDGKSLKPVVTPFGRIGGLICWENYMPLARMALYQQGLDLYLAPTADSRASWQATLRHIACESRCFVIGCNQFVTKDTYPADLLQLPELQQRSDPLCRGGSAIVDPLGDYVAGPLYDEEGVLFAQLPLQKIVEARFDFDPAGHYRREDVFVFQLKE